ncbi:MAG: ComF family protein [Treponema sp.]|jgi:ComF family protein|nr:ComF family protein [Treponema sp.]
MNYHYFDGLPGKAWRAVFYLREYCFPFGCALCGAGLVDGRETWYGLCGTCHAGIEREINENRAGEFCDCCGKPLLSEQGRCMACRQEESRSCDRVKVLFPYTGKYRQLLSAYKFGKNLAVGNFCAEKIRETLKCETFLPEVRQETRLVPVPPRPGKIRNSGWDQVEYLARLLERDGKNGLLVDRCLKRMPSQSQKELDRENRHSNLKGRIIPVRQAPKTAVILDDVMTTGSTLEVCAAALREAGAQTVYGLCLFYD